MLGDHNNSSVLRLRYSSHRSCTRWGPFIKPFAPLSETVFADMEGVESVHPGQNLLGVCLLPAWGHHAVSIPEKASTDAPLSLYFLKRALPALSGPWLDSRAGIRDTKQLQPAR